MEVEEERFPMIVPNTAMKGVAKRADIDIPLSRRELNMMLKGKCILKRGRFLYHNEGHEDDEGVIDSSGLEMRRVKVW